MNGDKLAVLGQISEHARRDDRGRGKPFGTGRPGDLETLRLQDRIYRQLGEAGIETWFDDLAIAVAGVRAESTWEALRPALVYVGAVVVEWLLEGDARDAG